MNPRERALSFWRHGSGINTDELRDLVAKYMPITDGEPIISYEDELISPDKDVLTALDAILYELKAIHKELQDGG